MRILLLVEKYV